MVSQKPPAGNDGASWLGRTFPTSLLSAPPPPPAGKCWRLERGEWALVPDVVQWPTGPSVPTSALWEAIEQASFDEAGSWGDLDSGQVVVRLFSAARSEGYLVVLLLGGVVNTVAVSDLPSLLSLLPSLVALVAHDEAIGRREEQRAKNGRRRWK